MPITAQQLRIYIMKEEIIYEIKHDHEGAYWHEFEGTLAECHEFMENYQGSDISVLTLKQKYRQ
jgi:hypothetical protein